MSSRTRRGRGRPPKTWALSPRSHFLKVKKPKSFAAEESEFGENAVGGSASSSPMRLEMRGPSREAARKSRSFIHRVLNLNNDRSVGGAWEDDASGYSGASDFEGADDGDGHGASDASNETFDDAASATWSEASYSTIGSTGRRRYFPKRSRTPELLDQKDIPPLTLPSSATDLVIDSENLLQALSVYEVLRHFRTTLRLSPFRFEDFCVALTSDEQCCLLSETHIALLKAMLREEDGNNTIFGPQDLKDSINICLHFLDSMTWYEIIRTYLDSDKTPEYRSNLPCLEKPDYCSLTVREKLNVLQTMADLFLGTNAIREEIMSEGNIHYDDHCRSCHRLGDLLCCEMCPAVYHLGCVVPPLEEVPENDWLCSVCRAHQLKGVCDCISEVEKSGMLCRQDPLGVDRHQRKYWFLCRRIVVEGDNEVWYYSSKVQLDELISTLDGVHWERDLVRSIIEVRDDVSRQMALIEELTHELKGHKRAVLDSESGALLRLQSERLLMKFEEAERKKRESEATTREDSREDNEEEEEESGTITGMDKDANMETSSSESVSTVTRTTTVTSSSSVTSLPNDTMTSSTRVEQVTQSVSVTATSVVTKVIVTDARDKDTGDKDAVGEEEEGEKEGGMDLLELARLAEEQVKQEEKVEEDGKNEDSERKGMKEGDAERQEMKEEEKNVVASQSSETSSTDVSAMDVVDEPVEKKAAVQTKVVHVSSFLPNVRVKILQPSDYPSVSQPRVSVSEGSLGLDDKEKGPDALGSQSKTGVLKTSRIITRSKTGSSTPKLFNDSVAMSVFKTTKTNSEESIVTVNRDSDTTPRVIRSRSSATVINHQVVHYRLGMENTYKSYENQYTANTLALNKHQHNEERGKRQHLSHKFSLTPLSDFKWGGNVHGNKTTMTATLRLSLTQLENAVPGPFLHPNWSLHRQNWLKAVHLCSKPHGFALILLTLESCIKPVLFNHVWHDSLGHTRLQRITVIEREEMKKRDKDAKQKKDNEEEVANIWVKYTLGLRHQVWKQKGEEYRVAGKGGWLWVSQTRRCLSISQNKVGLRAVATKLRADRAKTAAAKLSRRENEEVEKMYVDVDEDPVGGEEAITGQKPEKVDDLVTDGLRECELMLTESSSDKSDADRETASVELIDVSAELVARGQYPLCVKPVSRLDGLLEKRQKQYEIEMKNKALLAQALAKYRSQELNKKATPAKIAAPCVTSDNKLAVCKAGRTHPCYSVLCRREAFINGRCYSVTCTRHINNSHDVTQRSKSVTEVEKSNSESRLSNGLADLSAETGKCVAATKDTLVNCVKAAGVKTGESNHADVVMENDVDMNSVASHDSKHVVTLRGCESATSVESCVTNGSMSTTSANSDMKESGSTSPIGSGLDDSVSTSVGCSDTKDLTSVECSDTKDPALTSVLSSDTNDSVVTSVGCGDATNSVVTSVESSGTTDSVLTSIGCGDTNDSALTSVGVSDTNDLISVGFADTKDSTLTSDVSSCTKDPMLTGVGCGDTTDSVLTSVGFGNTTNAVVTSVGVSDTNDLTSVESSGTKDSALTSVGVSDTTDLASVESSDTKDPVLTSVDCGDTKESVVTSVVSSNTNDSVVTSIGFGDTKDSVSTSVTNSDTKCSVTSSDPKNSVVTSVISSDTKDPVLTSVTISNTKCSVVSSVTSSDTKCSVLESVGNSDTNDSTLTNVTSSDTKCSILPTAGSSDTKGTPLTKLVSSASKSSVSPRVVKSSVSSSVVSRITKASTSTSVVSGAAAKSSKSNTVVSMQALIQGGKIHLTPDSVAELESKLANVGCTRFKTSIGRFAHATRKSLAGRYVLRKGGIPNVHKFMTRARCSSLFCLDRFQTRRLARFGGLRETPGFNYNCKMNNVYWPYPCPRTLFKTAWRYRTHCVNSYAAAALQMRVLWACVRWDDLTQKPPAGGTNTVSTETDIVTTELLKRREIGPYGLQSEFLVRRINVPIGVTTQPKEKYTPQRSGLRERHRAESPTQREPSILEQWTPEEKLELWEIKLFAEKVEKQKAVQAEKIALSTAASAAASTPQRAAATTSAKTPSTKLELEDQLKQQRQAMQQRRLLDSARLGTASHRPLGSTLRVISTSGNFGSPSTVVRVMPVTSGGITRVVPQNTNTSGIHRLASPSQATSISIRPRSILSAGHVLGSPKVVKPLTTIRPAQIQVKGGTPVGSSPGGNSVQSLRIIQDQSGQMHVHGLLPGQQIVRLPDGRLQLLTTGTAAATQQQKPPAATTMTTTSAVLPMKIAVSQPPQQQHAVALQVMKNNMSPQKVPQQPLLQAVRLPSGQVQIRPLASGVRTITSSPVSMPKLTLMTPGVAPTLRIATTPGIVTTPRTVLTVVPPGGATTSQVFHQTAGVNVPLKQMVSPMISGLTPMSGVALPGGQPIIFKSVPAPVAVTAPVTSSVKQEVTLGSVLTAPDTSPASAGKYTVTPQVVQQVVRQAMLQTNDPEIQAKLAAMQKQMTLESATPDSSRPTTQQLMAVLQRQQHTHAEVTRSKVKVVTQEQREHKARMLVCTQVLKSLVDRVERGERHEEKRLRKLESADEKQRHVVEQQQQQTLLRYKEQLKRDMLRKRALLEKALSTHIQSEISAVVHQPPPPSQKTAPKRQHRDTSPIISAPVGPTPVTMVSAAGATNQLAPPSGAKKRKVISTGGKHSSSKLYCVCRTLYDETKFYIGCDLCSNWFHGACVGINESRAGTIDTYVCDECQRQKTNTSEELYCICQTPYDDTLFYIGCDRCQDWFHGTCVGVTKDEADHMDSYVCPNCRCTGRSDYDVRNQQLLVGRSWDQLRQLVLSLKTHKMSWPFLDAVDPKLVPEYYRVIKEPMDLTTVEGRVAQQHYVKLGDFVKDVMKVFDNCRFFNSSDTPYYQCAEVLENFFVQKLKNVKDTL